MKAQFYFPDKDQTIEDAIPYTPKCTYNIAYEVCEYAFYNHGGLGVDESLF